jgi:hypothetical protein
MYTTIKVSDCLKKQLENMKISNSESYEDVILDLIEDHLELNPEFKKSVERAEKSMKAGKGKSLAQVRKELGIDV